MGLNREEEPEYFVPLAFMLTEWRLIRGFTPVITTTTGTETPVIFIVELFDVALRLQ
jgi:hypothetical protein